MKATFKAALFSATLVLTGFAAVTWTACNNDKCKGIVCAYEGACNNGRCLCKSGYEGVQCETINRDRYKNTWQVQEDGTLSNEALYSLIISDGALITDVRIQNLNNSIREDVEATVKGDSITIPFQNAGTKTVVGKGIIRDDNTYGTHGVIEMYYSVTDTASGINDNYGLDSGMVSVWHK